MVRSDIIRGHLDSIILRLISEKTVMATKFLRK